MGEVVVAGVQRLFDQQTAEAGAVDKQVATDHLPGSQLHRLHVAGVRIQLHLFDQALKTRDPALLGVAAQKARVLAGIEVIRVGDVGQRRIGWHIAGGGHELAARGGNGIERVGTQWLRLAAPLLLDPVLMKRQQPERMADLGAEAVDIRGARPLPVDELDAELEAALGLAHELGFIDAEQIVEGLDVRHGGFADANGAELLGFDQLHIEAGTKHAGERGGRHPAGGSAADDDDVAEWSGDHDAFDPARKRKPRIGERGQAAPFGSCTRRQRAHGCALHQNFAPTSRTTLRGT